MEPRGKEDIDKTWIGTGGGRGQTGDGCKHYRIEIGKRERRGGGVNGRAAGVERRRGGQEVMRRG